MNCSVRPTRLSIGISMPTRGQIARGAERIRQIVLDVAIKHVQGWRGTGARGEGTTSSVSSDDTDLAGARWIERLACVLEYPEEYHADHEVQSSLEHLVSTHSSTRSPRTRRTALVC